MVSWVSVSFSENILCARFVRPQVKATTPRTPLSWHCHPASSIRSYRLLSETRSGVSQERTHGLHVRGLFTVVVEGGGGAHASRAAIYAEKLQNWKSTRQAVAPQVRFRSPGRAFLSLQTTARALILVIIAAGEMLDTENFHTKIEAFDSQFEVECKVCPAFFPKRFCSG